MGIYEHTYINLLVYIAIFITLKGILARPRFLDTRGNLGVLALSGPVGVMVSFKFDALQLCRDAYFLHMEMVVALILVRAQIENGSEKTCCYVKGWHLH